LRGCHHRTGAAQHNWQREIAREEFRELRRE
jgi:hypothetical protein